MRRNERRTTVEFLGLGLALAATLVLQAGPVRAEDAPPEPLTVLCLGDSLTEGYGLPPKQSYPAVLEARLHEQGYSHVRVINAGISGSTSASAVSRLKWQMRARPDVLILELGANDGLRGVSVEDTRKNLAAAIAMAQEAGTRVLLAGMKMPPNYGPNYTRDFEQTFAGLAEELDVGLIPFFLDGVAGVPRLNLPDGIHPTAEGYRIVVDNVLPHLLPLL
jgi:acyl-CoA thioesterase-1